MKEKELYWPVENCVRMQQCWASAIKKYPGWETFDVKDRAYFMRRILL